MRKITSLLLLGSFAMSLATAAQALTPPRCKRMCENKMDSTTSAIQSGKAVNSYFDCMSKCEALERAQAAYRACIEQAITERDKQRCRAQYRKDRPDI